LLSHIKTDGGLAAKLCSLMSVSLSTRVTAVGQHIAIVLLIQGNEGVFTRSRMNT